MINTMKPTIHIDDIHTFEAEKIYKFTFTHIMTAEKLCVISNTVSHAIEYLDNIYWDMDYNLSSRWIWDFDQEEIEDLTQEWGLNL